MASPIVDATAFEESGGPMTPRHGGRSDRQRVMDDAVKQAHIERNEFSIRLLQGELPLPPLVAAAHGLRQGATIRRPLLRGAPSAMIKTGAVPAALPSGMAGPVHAGQVLLHLGQVPTGGPRAPYFGEDDRGEPIGKRAWA